MDSSDKSKTSMPMPINIPSHLLSSASRQSAHANLLPKFYSPIPVSIAPYPYQASFSTEQASQLGLLSSIHTPTSVHMGFPHLSSASSLASVGGQNPMFRTAGLQVSASKKWAAQRQAPPKHQNNVDINQGPQKLSSTNKRHAQVGPPPKVQTELFESVRLKLRESLAASLAMVPDQQNKSQVLDKSSPKVAESTSPQAEEGIGPVGLTSTATTRAACTNSAEALTPSEQNTKCNECQDIPIESSLNEHSSDQNETRKDKVQEDQATHATLENEMPCSTNPVINDELLLGHGLCWASDIAGNSETIMNQDPKRPKLSHEEITERPTLFDKEVTGDSKDAKFQNAESLAIKIEGELFKLFGGVNKKYKEKARSLLFNLKDRSNPVLRERVLSGDIAPDRLCSMTAEELASEELSQWRLAKAEEFAHMVVLPDSEVDIRRLVKKTHKGEFQVIEVEQDDIISAEVAVGESVLSRVPSKANEFQTRLKSDEEEVRSMPKETKVSEGSSLPEKGSGAQNDPSNMDTLLNEKSDFMQDLIVDELKDTEFLPPIVSLDEFMQALDTEPPFDNISVDTCLPEKNLDNSGPEIDLESDSSEPKSEPACDNLPSELDPSEATSGSKLSPSEGSKMSPSRCSELSPPKDTSKAPQEIVINNTSEVDAISVPDNVITSSTVRAEPIIFLADVKSRSEQIWEGLLQLNISALSTVIGFFISGERTSTLDWPSFLEIKGRVRLDAFEKFIQELPLSRSRAIMIAQFCWKERSHESGRLNMIEAANSYIADERVGFAEPAQGVELYFCPPHPKTVEMLERHLPKDLTDPIRSTVDGLVGVVVWRRPNVTTISPRLSSHHKHGAGTKKQCSSRRQQQNVVNSSFPPSRHSTHPKPGHNDEPIEDVPPGFGPGSSRDEDDLPEFDFHSNPQQKGHHPHATLLPPPPARPVEQMRELIQMYGMGENSNKPGTDFKAWNDDDDIPEWQPSQSNQPQPQLQQQPQLQPLQLPPQMHQTYNNFQQPFMGNQNLMAQLPQMQQQMQQPTQMAVALPMHMQPQLHPQMGFMQGLQNMNMNPGWQQAGPSPWPGVMAMQPCQLNFAGQPAGNVQFYGAPAFGAVMPQNEMMGWRPDVPRNSGV